jgi:hypothetical protein
MRAAPSGSHRARQWIMFFQKKGAKQVRKITAPLALFASAFFCCCVLLQCCSV